MFRRVLGNRSPSHTHTSEFRTWRYAGVHTEPADYDAYQMVLGPDTVQPLAAKHVADVLAQNRPLHWRGVPLPEYVKFSPDLKQPLLMKHFSA